MFIDVECSWISHPPLVATGEDGMAIMNLKTVSGEYGMTMKTVSDVGVSLLLSCDMFAEQAPSKFSFAVDLVPFWTRR